MDLKNILIEVIDGVGQITINRPEVRNALDLETLIEIENTIEAWRNDDRVRVVIFTGSGEKSFAAGADIGQLQKRTMLEALRPNMTSVYRKIEEYEKATIAAINGYALGGGLELALACDIRIAAEHAKLGLPELNLAIIPGAGGTQRLARIIGKGKAIELILTGDLLSASQAEKLGLISKVATNEDLLIEAREIAAKIARKGPLAVRLVKSVIHHGTEVDMGTALLLEKLAQTILMGTEDKLEGTRAFLEKRVPEFKGK